MKTIAFFFKLTFFAAFPEKTPIFFQSSSNCTSENCNPDAQIFNICQNSSITDEVTNMSDELAESDQMDKSPQDNNSEKSPSL